MIGKSHRLLIQRLLVAVACAWLPVSTMAVPPCCCLLQRMSLGLTGGACCGPADDCDDSATPGESSGHPHRRCGCSVESIPATLPDAVSAVNATEGISAGLHFQATLLSHDCQLTFVDGSREWFLGLAWPRSSTKTCVALCRFLC
jgi:hypothetical protein